MPTEMEGKWTEPVFYQAKVGAKAVGFRAVSLRMTVCADNGDTPAKIRKKLVTTLEAKYAEMGIPVKIEVKELKKIRNDAVIFLV